MLRLETATGPPTSFIHHVPDDDPTGDEWPTVPKASAATLAGTVAA